MRKARRGLVALLATAVILAGCSNGGGGQTPTENPAPAAAAGDKLNLKGVCPDPIVIQTDWFPETEYGVYYNLIGPNPTIDTKKQIVSGPLVASGKDTGVKIEVRDGGPATGFELVSAQMYKNPAITLGQVNTDEAVRFSAKQPTLAVVAPMEISPFMLMWDPVTYPQFNIIVDIGQTDAKVFYFEGDTYMEYLVGSGILRRSQIDGSYDGTPANFVAADGKAVQAGFATSEPYIYSHEVRQWNKPVKYALVHDTGYPFYPQALSIRAADKDKLAPCLKKLVPIIQQSQVDFVRNPAKTNAFIVDLVKQYNAEWTYSPGLADYAMTEMKKNFVGDGSDKTLGNFETSRVQRIIDIVTPILTAQRAAPKANLKPEDLITNEFIDPSIGIGS
jgi:hypothetical protein